VLQPLLARSVAVRRVLAEAFVDDPLFQWIFPDPEMRLDATAAWMGLFVEQYLQHAHVDLIEVADEVVAAALWRPTYTGPLPYPEYPSLPGLLGALVGAERQRLLGQGLHAFSTARPDGPFAYLHFLAVAPNLQGQGLGKKLIQRGLDAATAAGVGVHLETTNPTTIGFYESLGFEVSHELALEPDGPPAWAMWRLLPAGSP
jgi:ribosomal protein S18 acetylase RimI-like enzyme